MWKQLGEQLMAGREEVFWEVVPFGLTKKMETAQGQCLFLVLKAELTEEGLGCPQRQPQALGCVGW